MRKETNCTQLRSNEEGTTIWRELAVEGIIHDVSVDGVYTVLSKLLKNALALQVPEEELATVAASHQDLLVNGVRSKDPGVLLQGHATAAGQVIDIGSVDRVPHLYAADFNLGSILGLFPLIFVLELGGDRSDHVAAVD
jgi:hypothetical protein